MNWLTLFIILSAATYRVGRFIIHDTLWEEQREALLTWIVGDGTQMWRIKVVELFRCPFCITVWVAAALVALTVPLASVPLPVWTWLAVAAGSLVFWEFVEGEE